MMSDSFSKLYRSLRLCGVAQTARNLFFRLRMRGANAEERYRIWRSRNEGGKDSSFRRAIESFENRPLISVCLLCKEGQTDLSECVDSVLQQDYPNFELCVLASGTMGEWKDKRVFFVRNDGTGAALDAIRGEFVVFLRGDGTLSRDALFQVVSLLNAHPDAELVYSDEDVMETDRKAPFFKPDYSPETLLSYHYISDLAVYRTSLVRKIGAFRDEYDLILRFTEKADRIYHIPKILYHRKRAVENISSSALEDAIKRRGYRADLKKIEGTNARFVRFRPKEDDFVSIIIPTKDNAKVLDRCLCSIYEKTTGVSFEIIVVNNNSSERETFALFERYQERYGNFRVLTQNVPYNYSALNNEAVKIAKGNLLLFLNNDVEVITPGWLSDMAGEATRLEIGAVGARLLFPDGSIQHAGIVLLGKLEVGVHFGYQVDERKVLHDPRYVADRNVSAVTGACLMMRRGVFDEIGGFDESLAVEFNDVDLCLKALRAGYRNLYMGQVCLYHYESMTRRAIENSKRLNDSILKMANRWGNFKDPYFDPDAELKLLHFII